ncbi:hypothetical protein NDU88_007017 [Pleurodeles waltl]|uniref:Uncharacterized protein n=1 Tax=Pleurodeles waltl TaxID=8319 RepID=A0AAV7NRV6_PLEWA|nr:hypothetical protein NDU88_007017 [Pleurodeles waltl]
MNPPTTKRDVRMFLGMVGYCRQWIPNFSIISKPFIKLTGKEVQDDPGNIILSEKGMKAFMELRECMCRAPALGMPDYTKPFLLFCHERDACSLSVLTQVHGGANCPVAYFSATLDPVAAALPGCLRAVAAVGQSLTQCEGIVMGHPLTVMVPHSVEISLTRTKTQHMTNARSTRYKTVILGSPNVSLKRCTVLNPATLLPIENADIREAEEVEHDCLEVTELCTKPRPDIKDTQLQENDYIMFVDGSCLRDSVGVLRAGYAVCTITGILEASWLERVYSAQVAELIALTKSCHAAENLKVTIYTDSRYEFGIVHDFGQLWSQMGFMTSSGSPVKNGEKIKDLLHAIQLPLEIAVVKCNAHFESQDFVSMVNGYADQVARCIICQQMNAGKGTVVNMSHVGRAGGPFSRMQMDFIEMPVCGGLRYVLVIVCVFSHWIEAYPTRRTDSLTVAKLLLRELIPRFGFPISLESDTGRHFENEVIKLLYAALNIEQKLHCSYHPEASGLVEQMNGTLNSRMVKMCAATNLKWPDALPLVLMSMRKTPDKKTGLSLHEILMGRAMRLPAVPANALVNITDDMVLDYCKGLADVAALLLTSHTKIVTCPTDEKPEASKTTAAEKEVSGPESIQRGTEIEGDPTENSSVTQSEFQRGDSEPISAEVTGEPTQREVLPEADGFGFEVEPVTDPEGEGEEAEGGQSELTPPEPIAGPSRENTIAQEEVAVQRSEKPSKKKTHKGDNCPKPQAAI